MANPVTSPRIAIIAGLVAVVAVAAAAYWAMSSKTATDSSAAAKPVKLIEMIGKNYPIGQTVEALEAPIVGAATATRLRQGADVRVIGIVEGDAWYQVELPDKHLAYVQVGAIPAAAPPAIPPQTTVAAPTAPAPAAVAPAAPAESANASTAPAATTAPGASATPSAAADEPTIDLPPTTEFVEANEQLSVAKPTSVYLAPDKRSPPATPLNVGTLVEVIAKTKDGNWAWVNADNGTPAYVPTADLGPIPAK